MLFPDRAFLLWLDDAEWISSVAEAVPSLLSAVSERMRSHKNKTEGRRNPLVKWQMLHLNTVLIKMGIGKRLTCVSWYIEFGKRHNVGSAQRLINPFHISSFNSLRNWKRRVVAALLFQCLFWKNGWGRRFAGDDKLRALCECVL